MTACEGTFLLRSNPSGRIIADKREIKDFPKLPSATSHIRKRYTQSEVGFPPTSHP